MAKSTKTAKVEMFDNEKLKKPIEYAYEYETFDTLSQAKESDKWPGDNTILSWLNTDAERTSKAASYQKAVKTLRDVKGKTLDSQRAAFVNSAVNAGVAQEEAEKLAKAVVPELDRHKAASAMLTRLLNGEVIAQEAIDAVVNAT